MFMTGILYNILLVFIVFILLILLFIYILFLFSQSFFQIRFGYHVIIYSLIVI